MCRLDHGAGQSRSAKTIGDRRAGRPTLRLATRWRMRQRRGRSPSGGSHQQERRDVPPLSTAACAYAPCPRFCGMVASAVQPTAPVGPLMSEGGEGLRPVASCAVLRSASSGATRMQPSVYRARPDTGSYRISIDSRAKGRAEPCGRRFRSATVGSTPCDGWRQPDVSSKVSSPPRTPRQLSDG